MAEKKDLRLDLTDFNISLVDMLTFLKERGDLFENIFNSSKTESNINSEKDITIKQNIQGEEKVDLTKLKLNIQALKEAVKIAKQTKEKKGEKDL